MARWACSELVTLLQWLEDNVRNGIKLQYTWKAIPVTETREKGLAPQDSEEALQAFSPSEIKMCNNGVDGKILELFSI